MFPQEARLRNFTYSSNMTLDMNIKYIVVLERCANQSKCFTKKYRASILASCPLCFGLLSVFSSNISMFRVALLANAIWILVGISSSMARKRHVSDKSVRQRIASSVSMLQRIIPNGVGWLKLNQYLMINVFHPNNNMYVSSKNNGFETELRFRYRVLKHPFRCLLCFARLHC